MGQRDLICGACGSGFEVPVDYFNSKIRCPHCGIAVDRRSGSVAVQGPQPAQQPAAPQQYARPQQQQQQQQYAAPQPHYPPQQYAMPPQYGIPPQYAGQYAAPPRRSNHWMWLLLLIPAGVVGILALAAIPLITAAGVPAGGQWHQHVDSLGGYSIEFPRAPSRKSEQMPTGLGPRTRYIALLHAGGAYFESAWFDLGPGRESDYEFSYPKAANGFASQKGGSVTNQTSYVLGDEVGSLVTVTGGDRRLSTMLLIRRGNRVYTVLVENHRSSDQAAVDRYIRSFQFDG